MVCVGLVGAAAASAVASTARPLSCAVPSAPTSQQAVAGTNQATITWTAADGNGSTLTGNVVRALSGPNAGESIATEGSAAQLTMGGLAGGSPVTFSVVAESACGTGPTATTTAVTPTGTATTYVTTVLAKHPSAYYRLSDPSGTIMADSSGNAADGQYTTCLLYTSRCV